MTADRTTTADTGAEDPDAPPAPERRPPPDTPGAADAPSRADSRAGAAAANDTADSKSEADEDTPPTAEPAGEGSDDAPSAEYAREPVNAEQDEGATAEAAADRAATADDEIHGPAETAPAEIEEPRDAVEVARKNRPDIPDAAPEDAIPADVMREKTGPTSGTSSSTDRRSSAVESSEPAPADQDPGRGAADAGSPVADVAPVIGDDGAWEWKGLRLDPEANRIADLAYAERRIAEGRDEAGNYAEHGITPGMRRIAGELDHGELVGCPEFSLKSEERFKEKLAKKIGESPGLPAREVAGRIHDGIRYTFVFDPGRYSAGVHDTRRRLEEAGYSLEFQRPTWDDPDYKGVNSRWRDPGSGQLFEVQFHTPQSWDAKQTTHDAYEKMAAPTTPPEEVARLQEYQREVTSSVVIPPGALTIPYFEKED